MAKNKKNRRQGKKALKVSVAYTLRPAKYPAVKSALAQAGQLLAQGRAADTLALCSQIVEIEPRNAEIFLTVASACELTGDVEQAEQAYKSAFKLIPNFVPGMVNYGLMLFRAGLLERSLAVFRSTMAIAPDFVPAIEGASQALSELRRYEDAVPVFEKMVQLRGGSIDFLDLADMLDKADQPKRAAAICQKALAVSPDKSAVKILAGMLSLNNGDNEAAIDHFKAALEYNENTTFAYMHLVKIDKGTDYLGDIEKAIKRTGEHTGEHTGEQSALTVRAPLLFAKALLLEKAGDYAEAFSYLTDANAMVVEQKTDYHEERTARALIIRETYTSEAIQALHKQKCDQSERPVFVTGLPRSGTSLVAQILASHSKIGNLGEHELVTSLLSSLNIKQPTSLVNAAKSYRAAYPARLADKQRIVDKSIGSTLQLGAIAAMFPNARIIYCDRHPMDVAWSAFKQYFNDGSLGYTYSFERIAEHQKIYAQNIDHWCSVLGEQILRVRYEDLVQAPEENAKLLVSHLNFPWEEACLDFYKNKSPVRTASYDQVRQPIYTSSVGGWKHYEPWLGELKSLLKDEIEFYENSATV